MISNQDSITGGEARFDIIQQFSGKPLRIVGTPQNPLFVAADICSILEIKNPRDAVASLDFEEKGVALTDTLGGQQNLSVVTESGLYHLIFKSRKTEAKKFRRWVTDDVLPSIRKTGSYGTPRDPMEILADPAAMRSLLLGYTEKVLSLETTVSQLEPKAVALDRISAADGSMCITDAAKTIGVGRDKLFDFLSQNAWIYRRAGAREWVAYQPRISQGVLEHRVAVIEIDGGEERIRTQVLVTAKGLTVLAKIFKEKEAA